MRDSLVGLTESHLCSTAEGAMLGAMVHRDVVAPFLELRMAARMVGFDIALASGFRSFERQLSIWNRKVTGGLLVLDSSGEPLDIAMLTPRELVYAILRWSALPGASRHHWGTDVDVYDAGTTPEGYEVLLIPAEVDAGGMHAALHEWLDARIAGGAAYGFYRPYDRDRGGVAPERWHLSYAPIAREHQRVVTPALLRETLERVDLQLKDVVLGELDEIHARFVANVGEPPLSLA